MAIKYFIVYVGSLLVISVALMVLVRQWSEHLFDSGNKPVMYGSFSAVSVSMAAFAATYITTHLFTIFWVFAGIFFLFGLVHVLYINSIKNSLATSNGKSFLAEVIFGFSILLFSIAAFSSLQYFIDDNSFLFYPLLMSVLLFFVPILTFKTYEFARDIPVPQYNTWTYPVNNPLHLPTDDSREKLLVISFLLKTNEEEATYTHFRAKGPANMKLGDLYYFFINDYNEINPEKKISFTNGSHEPYEWWFYLKPQWYKSTHVLDPHLTLSENKVKENGVIICERTYNQN